MELIVSSPLPALALPLLWQMGSPRALDAQKLFLAALVWFGFCGLLKQG
jgi:hypothetical protein